MASDEQRTTTEPAEPVPCAPCRATGSVISNLGGVQAQVPCPWCDGSGLQIPAHDAQAARREAASAPS